MERDYRHDALEHVYAFSIEGIHLISERDRKSCQSVEGYPAACLTDVVELLSEHQVVRIRVVGGVVQRIVVEHKIDRLIEIILPGENVSADARGVEEVGGKGGVALT